MAFKISKEKQQQFVKRLRQEQVKRHKGLIARLEAKVAEAGNDSIWGEMLAEARSK